MMEKEIYFAWYRLRGLGLVCLCSFVFFFGAYLANQRSMAVSGPAGAQTMPIDCVEREDNKLALSFDVTDGSGSVETLLNLLGQYGVKATFFVTERWMDAYPEETKRIVDEGHDLASRGTDRESMTRQTNAKTRKLLRAAREKAEALTGAQMRLFRAPYGEYDRGLLGAAAAEGFLPVRWSVDSEDWKDYGAESIVKRVTEHRNLGAGAIIRMHGGASQTAHALETIITDLREQGYELAPVSQLVQ